MSFSATIGHTFARRAQGDIGIEVEVEFPQNKAPIPITSDTYWTTKQDGSLRNGFEYVLTRPVLQLQLSDAMKEFEKGTRGYGFTQSDRTSVHIHINACPMTFEEVTRSLTAYYLFENVFLAANDKSRSGNLFCLRGKDAEWQVNAITKCIREGWKNNINRWGENWRYAALNLAALRQFGSLEYRFVEGTTNPELIHFWAQTLYDFTRNSAQMPIEDQLKIVTAGSDGQFDFLNKVLTRPTDLFDKLPRDWPELVEENIPYGIAFRQAYVHAQKALSFKPKAFRKPVIFQCQSDDLPGEKTGTGGLKKKKTTPWGGFDTVDDQGAPTLNVQVWNDLIREAATATTVPVPPIPLAQLQNAEADEVALARRLMRARNLPIPVHDEEEDPL